MSCPPEIIPDSKVHGANMGPIWGRQDPGGPHVGPMNLAIWDMHSWIYLFICSVYMGVVESDITGEVCHLRGLLSSHRPHSRTLPDRRAHFWYRLGQGRGQDWRHAGTADGTTGGSETPTAVLRKSHDSMSLIFIKGIMARDLFLLIFIHLYFRWVRQFKVYKIRNVLYFLTLGHAGKGWRVVWSFINLINILGPRKYGRHFAEYISNCILLNENVCISLMMSLKFILNARTNNITALI